MSASLRVDPLAPFDPARPVALPTRTELRDALGVVHGVIPPTPQYRWPLLDARFGAEVWVKHENHTPIGAFKARSAIVYLDHLHRAHPDVTGVVSATRGNHGQAVGFAARWLGLGAAIVVPHGNSVEKNAAMRALGVELIEHGHDFQAAAEHADVVAEERGWHRMPSFHPLLVRGAATYAMELFRAVHGIDTVYVPIGLGSGICGVIAARDALDLDTRVVGVVAAAAPAYALSLEAGRPVSHESATRIADGMAVRVPDAGALEIIRRGSARVVRVGDDEIERAMRVLFTDTHNVAEGGGAAALAAALQERRLHRGRRIAVILSGGNVDSAVFGRILLEET